MTLENLNIILTNALCCVSRKASEISHLYSIGNKCADSEVKKLKILIDKINIIKDYYFTGQDTSILLFEEPFNIGVFSQVPPGWNSDYWIWNAKRINTSNTPPYIFPDSTSGLIALEGNNISSTITKSNLLTINKKYKVSFDLYYTSDNATGLDTVDLQIGLGDNYIEVGQVVTSSRITLSGICKTNTNFNIRGTLSSGNPVFLIDNIEILRTPETCFDDEQVDKLVHDIMRECDICDCQLNQDN